MIALPGIVYLLINNYIQCLVFSWHFKNYSLRKGVFGSDWCGLQNFQFFVQDQRCLDYDQKHNFYIMWLSLLSERSLQLQLL